MEDDNELKTFIKIWLIAIASLCYCYFIPRRISAGLRRLFSLLPVATTFLLLPLPLSAVHLAGPTVFYLVWLANFKLLLFAFNRGPLASSPPLTLFNFASIALLPINPIHSGNRIADPHPDPNSDPSERDSIALRPINPKNSGNKINNPDPDPNPDPVSYPNSDPSERDSIALRPINPKHSGNKINNPDPDPNSDPDPVSDPVPDAGPNSDPISESSNKPLLLAIKALILALIVSAYQYRENLHRNVILGMYCIHVYLGVELVLAITAFFVRFFLRFDFEIEPQFNEPYLATSLQDFWGHRWNLMVTRILRPAVYDPVREVTSPVIGKLWSRLPAIVLTFVVSGLMHELVYFYLTRVRPTWEVTLFFVVHGVCTAVEVVVKKVVGGRFRLHRAVSTVVTVAFVAVTGGWLFLPQILRNGVDVKAIDEYSIVVDFLRSKLG